MDWNGLRDQVSNISLYDIKAGVRKVQNAVMNYTEMEAKVREATNNEPWGASSTLMQEIANGTFNYQLLNEIMPMIYKRFTEKSAEEWRQIYKALQLMEFLIKNGSERVIDDARSHLSLLKMLRQFHYIDNNGKDQGINVRNRSKELADLLGDVDKIRSERKKSRTTRTKYSGVEGGAGLGGSSSASRYGGFGSETGGTGAAGYGGASRSVYGDGGGFGGETNDEYDESEERPSGNDRFDEYDEYDDGAATASATRRKAEPARSKPTPKKPDIVKPKEPEVDLFDFGDEPAASTNGNSALAAPAATTLEDDDFDDFQSAGPPITAPVSAAMKPNYNNFAIPAAPTATTQQTRPIAQPAAPQTNLKNNLFSTTSPLATASAFSPPAQAQKPAGYQPSGPNYYQSVQAAGTTGQSTPTSGATTPAPGSQQAKKPTGGDAFASLLAGSGIKKSGNAGQKSLTIADMAKQKSTAGLYGANAAAPVFKSTSSAPKPSTGSSGLDDLLG